MAVEPIVHRCIVQHGSMAGNKRSQDVTEFDIEYGLTCENCGEELAPTREVLAFIYAQLLALP